MKEILSTHERIKILKEVIYTEEDTGVNKLAKKLQLSKGFVSKFLQILEKEGILKKAGKKFILSESPVIKGIKILFNIELINQNIFKKYKFVKSAGIYGSCAKGENRVDSDVDIWVKIENVSQEDEVRLLSELRRKIKNVKVVFLTEEKINRLKKEDTLFYYSLFFGSIVIYGEKNGI